MIVIGIVGGIASGKSFVTAHLQSLGGVVLDADQIGHQILLQDSVKQAIHDRWSDNVFDAHGEVDRRKLAEVVFNPNQPEELHHLEKITHPRIQQRLDQQIAELRLASDVQYLILDAPVMVKAGWHVLCDELIFVEASEQNRWQRASRRGWTREMFQQREAMQAPLAQKRKLATCVVENDGEKSDTVEQLNAFWIRVQSQKQKQNRVIQKKSSEATRDVPMGDSKST